MPTYTTNLGIQKPVNGTQNGTWGDTVNTNMDIIDVGVNGVKSVTLFGASGSIDTSDGTVSATGGQYKTIILGGSITNGSGSPFPLTVTPSTVQKLYFFKNTTAAYVEVEQGAGTTTAVIPPGYGAIVYTDGNGNAFDLSTIFQYLSTANGGNVDGDVGISGSLGVGTTSPDASIEVSGSTTSVSEVTASISGTEMTVTGVATGTLSVGQYIFGANISPNTYITALGTGTGTTGTYSVSVAQTAASAQVYAISGTANRIRITDTDTTASANQPVGTLEFFGTDSSAGVAAYVTAVSESSTPDTALVFGTRDSADAGVAATEAMRITSAGNVGIGTASPSAPLHVSTSSDTDTLILESSSADATDAPDLVLFRSSASPAADDLIGDVVFKGKTSTAADATYAKIGARIVDPTNSSTDASIFFQTVANGTLDNRLVLGPTSMSFATDYLIGVGTTTPATAITVSGSTGASAAQVTGYIASASTVGVAGVTLNVTAVTSGTLAVGQYIYGPSILPNTYITALGTGTGGVGTYTVSVSQATPSGTVYAIAASTNRVRVTDTDTTSLANQPVGTLEFYTSDGTTPGEGVGAYVSAVSGTTSMAQVSGYISNGTSGTAGTVLTVTSVTYGTLAVGQTLYGSGVTVGTTITAVNTSAAGVVTYTVSASQAAGTSGSPATIYATSSADDPRVSLVFGTRSDPATGSGAVERMRIDGSGNVTVAGTVNGVTVVTASQPQAEAGTSNDSLMTPLRTAQAMLALPSGWQYIGAYSTITSGNINIKDLAGWRHLLVQGVNLTSASGTGLRSLRVSSDNGTTYLNTGIYLCAGGNVAQTEISMHNNSGTAARSPTCQIIGFGETDPVKSVVTSRDPSNSDTVSVINTASALNAIRVFDSDANINGGTVYLWGMR